MKYEVRKDGRLICSRRRRGAAVRIAKECGGRVAGFDEFVFQVERGVGLRVRERTDNLENPFDQLVEAMRDAVHSAMVFGRLVSTLLDPK